MVHAWLLRLFPFLGWFPIQSTVLRADLIAGITGALVLVPKAMAYAQLSGLPVYFGLYTALVPAIVGALWGSSRQLATGPVAVISLMTAAALTPLAVPFSDEYIGLALLLTLMVGAMQLGLGVLKLGTIVNFVSHPVILGFMNAAAIIIALSQLDKLLRIPKGRSDTFLVDIWEMAAYLPHAHLPTLAMAGFSLLLMLGLKKARLLSRLSVLIAVAITTVVSYQIGFERKAASPLEAIADQPTRQLAEIFVSTQQRIARMHAETAALGEQLRAIEKAGDVRGAVELRHRIDLVKLDAATLETRNKERQQHLRQLELELADPGDGRAAALYLADTVPPGVRTDGRYWRIARVAQDEVHLVGGGEVVGTIPAGLPAIRVPTLNFEAFLSLFSSALVIALVAFMESISMAKAMSAQSRQRIDPNQELVGQGLANLGGAFFQSYPACGSFTGSAINLQAGAQTGFAMVFNGLFVALTLLFLTPYLYHLPQATLAVIIILAVTGLVTPKAILHAWKANRADGIAAIATFAGTLIAAPHLDKGIIFGAALALVLFLYRTMRPRVARLGRFDDGTLRDIRVHPGLPTSKRVIAMRFDGQLYFANVAYFEDMVLGAVAEHPEAKYVLVVGDGINQLDASGDDAIRHLDAQLRATGITLVFSGLKKQVLDVMRHTGLFEQIGESRIFSHERPALAAIYEWLGEEGAEDAFRPR